MIDDLTSLAAQGCPWGGPIWCSPNAPFAKPEMLTAE
jgi:hypothetical protein